MNELAKNKQEEEIEYGIIMEEKPKKKEPKKGTGEEDNDKNNQVMRN